MNIPGIGEIKKDDCYKEYCSQPLKLSVLEGTECRFVLEGYAEETQKSEFHTAISNLLSASSSILREAEVHIYQYYQDIYKYYSDSDEDFVSIESATEIWAHIRLGKELIVSRRTYGDQQVYISFVCNCDWEPEHGLQIVFKNGKKVCKVGPYDSHLTNSDAFGDKKLEDVIYHSFA